MNKKNLLIITIILLINMYSKGQSGEVYAYEPSLLVSLNLSNGNADTVGNIGGNGIISSTFDVVNHHYIFKAGDGTVKVINTSNANIITSLPFSTGSFIEYDGTYNKVYSYYQSMLISIDLSNGIVNTIGMIGGAGIISSTYDAINHHYIFKAGDGTVKIIDSQNAGIINSFPFSAAMIEYDAAYNKVYGYDASLLLSLDLTNGNIDTIGNIGGNGINSSTYDALNHYYIFKAGDGTVKVVNTSNANIVSSFPFPGAKVEYDPVLASNSEQYQSFPGFNIFPNPSNNYFNIIYPENIFIDTIEIRDIYGNLISESPFTKQLNIESFSKGIYFLTLNRKGYNSVTKLIVKE